MTMTTADAARELGVSEGRIRQLICTGRLRTTRQGRDHMISLRDLEKVRERKNGRPFATPVRKRRS